MTKKLLIERDIEQLDDFQKILLLNKGKLSYDDVDFYNSEGEDFGEIIEVTKDGLMFNFEDLEQFLKFFFPNSYGENDSDGAWDARNYDSMYYQNYDFNDDCYNRSSDDWREGYTLGYFCKDALVKLKELIGIISPSNLQYFSEDGTKIVNGEGELSSVIENIFKNFEDEASEIICSAKSRILSNGASEYIKEAFCDGLKPFGIQNWSLNRLGGCFNTYFMSWGSLIQMYLYKGDFSDNALDVMFEYLEKSFKSHPNTYYEVEYDIFDNEKYEELSCEDLVKLVDGYIEDATEEFNPKYLEVMDKLSKLNLFDSKLIPGTKNTYMKVKSVDTETLQTNYVIGTDRWMYNAKYGSAPVDEVINMATQPGLFDQTQFRVDPSSIKK